MNISDPYEVYQSNLECIKSYNPEIASKLEKVDISGVNHEIVCGQSCTVAINGIQLTSRHNPEHEAKLRCGGLVSTETVDIFGFECGYTARNILRHFEKINIIRIHILSLSIFKLVLHLGSIEDIISNPRIILCYEDGPFDLTTGKFCFNPAEIITADEKNWKIRDRLLYQSLIKYTNNSFYDKWLAPNSDNQWHLPYKKYAGVSSLFGSKPGSHCYVIGAGPTLEKNVERLKAILALNKDSLVISCDTAATGLIGHGIRPDFIVSIDPKISSRHMNPDVLAGIPVVFGIHSDIDFIDTWNGPTFISVPDLINYQHLSDIADKGKLFSGGSVIHPATDLAVKLGSNSITFLGADFSFPFSKTHSFWEEGALALKPSGFHWVMNGHNEKIPTDPNFANYLVALEHLISISPRAAFFNSSKDGAVISGTDFDPTFGDLN